MSFVNVLRGIGSLRHVQHDELTRQVHDFRCGDSSFLVSDAVTHRNRFSFVPLGQVPIVDSDKDGESTIRQRLLQTYHWQNSTQWSQSLEVIVEYCWHSPTSKLVEAWSWQILTSLLWFQLRIPSSLLQNLLFVVELRMLTAANAELGHEVWGSLYRWGRFEWSRERTYTCWLWVAH